MLAGGESRRMRSDKGALSVEGQTLVARCLQLVQPVCKTAYVSVRSVQSGAQPYRDLPLVTDDARFGGPAAGLLSAWLRFPEEALLVVAVDLPLITARTLDDLVSRRKPTACATAFRHGDGTIEPLCTIWEPKLRTALLEAETSPSLRRILEESDVHLLDPPDSAELVSTNTPEALAAAQDALEDVR